MKVLIYILTISLTSCSFFGIKNVEQKNNSNAAEREFYRKNTPKKPLLSYDKDSQTLFINSDETLSNEDFSTKKISSQEGLAIINYYKELYYSSSSNKKTKSLSLYNLYKIYRNKNYVNYNFEKSKYYYKKLTKEYPNSEFVKN